jgi:1-acyl-sn-glycerol-3-phosphate acyltransferase
MAHVLERPASKSSALRSLVFLLFQIVVTPLYAFAMLLFSWLPRVPRYNMAKSWCRVNLWAARWICGIRWRVIGVENIPKTPHVVMSKHSSTWETLALNLYFPPLAFVAKKELLSIPFFGWGFALASPITIDRKAGKDAMELMAAQGRERFRQGFWIVVYPEGTRIPVGRRVRYKTGGARLAIALPAPILPVAHNAGYLWPKGLFGKRPGTITLSIGPSISTACKDMAELIKEVEDWIEGEVERLGPAQ